MVLLLAVRLVGLVVLVAVAVVVTVVKTRALDARAAAKYARSMGLPLPPELAPWVEWRLRRRVRVASVAVSARDSARERRIIAM